MKRSKLASGGILFQKLRLPVCVNMHMQCYDTEYYLIRTAAGEASVTIYSHVGIALQSQTSPQMFHRLLHDPYHAVSKCLLHISYIIYGAGLLDVLHQVMIHLLAGFSKLLRLGPEQKPSCICHHT